MKYVICILLVAPFLAMAQKRDSVAMKKANRIIVVTDLPAKENYQLLVTVLSDNGYTVQGKKSDSLNVFTAEQPAQSAAVTYHINGWAKENEIVLSGSYNAKVDASLAGTNYKTFVVEVANTGGKKSASRYIFRLIQNLARQMNGKLLYTIEATRKTSLL